MVCHAAADKSPKALTLTARDPLLRLAREVLAQELAALRRHLPADRSAPDPDSIHQLRIAIRRIRVALRLFADFRPDATRHLRDELKWIGRALGQVRDLDVFQQRLAPLGEPLPPAAAPLEAWIAQQRAAARSELAVDLAAPRFAELTSRIDDFLHHDLRPSTLRRWQSLRIGAAARSDLRDGLARVLTLGRKIGADTTPKQLHRLRIRAKRLRYASEFYAPYRPAAQKLARAAKSLQDTLGAYRDACHAADLLRHGRVAQAQNAACAAVIDALVEAQCADAAAARRHFSLAWRRFEKRAEKTRLTKKRH